MATTTVTVVTQSPHGEQTTKHAATVAAYDIEGGQLTVRLADSKEAVVNGIHTYAPGRWIEVHLALTETVN